jgi:hypothetical protein
MGASLHISVQNIHIWVDITQMIYMISVPTFENGEP